MPAHRVQAEWTGLGGAPYLTTLYLDTDQVPAPQAASDLVAAFLSDATAEVSTAARYDMLPEVVTYASPDVVATVTPVTSTGANGRSAGDAIPLAAQALIRWRTETFNGARRVLGRTFLPGYVEAQNGTNGRPVPALVTALSAAGNALADEGLVVASRALNTFAPVIGASCWTEWAVLRSRRD